MKTATIVLHDEEFTVQELKARKLSAWLTKLEGPLVAAMTLVGEAMDTDVEAPDKLQALIGKVTQLVGNSIDQVLDLMVEFAPELEGDIDECYSSEIVPAFVEVLKLAVPFDLDKVNWNQALEKVTETISQVGELKASGSSASSTSTSSQEPSGTSGPTTSTEMEAE